MASYPTLSSGSVALFPVTRTINLPVAVHRALDDTEQRWQRSAPLNSFRLDYADLSGADRDLIEAFIDTIKGGYDDTWDITLGGTTYSYCCLVGDTFEPRENQAESWDFSVQLRQVAKSGFPSPGVPSAFPSLTGDITTRRPWGYQREFLNSIVDMPTGPRHAFYHRASPLPSWEVGGDNLPDADITALLEFFIGAQGRYLTWEFTDPETGDVHSKCRLGSDQFEAKSVGPNENSCYLQVVEVAA